MEFPFASIRPAGWAHCAYRWLAVLGVLALITTSAACARGQDSAPAAANGAPADSDSRAVIVTVRTQISVDDVTPAADKVRELVAKYGGIIAHGSVRGDEGDRLADFEARIPAGKLEAFRSELDAVGEIDSDSEQVEDVTAPRADLEARLHNARAHEKRLLSLLDEKTGDLTDVIAIEKEIASVREGIEQMEAEKRVMDRKIALATVHIALRPAHANLWAHPGEAIAKALDTGLRGARNLVVGTAIVAAAALPSLLVLMLGAVVLFVFVRAVLRRRARRLGVTP